MPVESSLHPSPSTDELYQALFDACKRSDWDMATALASRGASFSCSTGYRGSALSIAVSKADPTNFQSLLAVQPLSEDLASSAFLDALGQGLPEIASILLRLGANPLTGYEHELGGELMDALEHAIQGGNLECCKLAIIHGPAPCALRRDLGFYWDTHLGMAAAQGNMEVVELLYPYFTIHHALGSPAHLSFQNLAIVGGNADCMRLAWNGLTDVQDSFSGRSLVYLAQLADTSMLDLFLSIVDFSKVDLSTRLEEDNLSWLLPGLTPLMAIVGERRLRSESVCKCVAAILQFSDPHAVDIFGRDALMLGIDFCQPSTDALVAMASWADLSRTDEFGETALDKAIAHNRQDLADVLMDHSALRGLGSRRLPFVAGRSTLFLDWSCADYDGDNRLQDQALASRRLRLGANPHVDLSASGDIVNEACLRDASPLCIAVNQHWLGFIVEALTLYPGPSRAANMALREAAQKACKGSIDLCKAMLAGGADPAFIESSNSSALISACQSDRAGRDQADVIRLLLPLSSLKGDASHALLALLAFRSDAISFVIVIDHCRAEGVFDLFSHGQWASLAKYLAPSASMWAAVLGALSPSQKAQFLSAANLLDASGRNALSRAAIHGNCELFELLKSEGIAASCDILGMDPLMQALAYGAENNDLAILLSTEADPSILDHRGESALQKALAKGHHKIVEIIECLRERIALDESVQKIEPALDSGLARRL